MKKVKQIHLKTCLSDEEAAKFAGKLLDDSHYDILIEEDTDVYTPEGTVLIKYRNDVIPAGLCKAAYPSLRKAATTTDNRGYAAGEVEEGAGTFLTEGGVSRITHVATSGARVRRIKKDGTLSNTQETIAGKRVRQGRFREQDIKGDGTLSKQTRAKPVKSGLAGYYNREARFPYCRLTAFNLNKPQDFAKALPFIQAISNSFKELYPERYEAQMEVVKNTSKDFLIHGTAFTTITINSNWQTAVHTDKGDLKAGFGVMSVLRAGEYKGCYLVFPKYRVAVNMQTRSILLADVHQWHGNTPLKGMPGTYERLSLVFYYREKMKFCESAGEELERAKRRKRGTELNG